ncbi:MAG: endopeptidase La [Planctomycetota bacterium]|jgi:ATP-dependent Lon protease
MSDNTANSAQELPPINPDTETLTIPEEIPFLPIKNMVLFPDMILPLVISSDSDNALVDATLLKDRILGMVPQVVNNEEDGEITREELHTSGCVGVILKMLKFPDHTTRILVQGVSRFKITGYTADEPFFKGKIKLLEEKDPGKKESKVQFNALFRGVKDTFQNLISKLPNFPEEIRVASMNINEPGRLSDLIAANINISMVERCEVLDAAGIRERLEKISVFLEREMQMVDIGKKIQDDVQEKVGKGQREFYLREQLKSIRKELGEDDDMTREMEELRTQLEEANLPEEARKEADRELKRIENMQPGSAEYTVSRTYLDWMAVMPWEKITDDIMDIKRARKIMDADHFGLEKPKERIIEYLAVRKINPEGRGPIICFAGPPGVGKTSLGRSIAKALGREFIRISLGGVRDEAEIRGHRRTYIGALPGRIIQGLRKAGTKNPVFMMDEIDKLASDFRGDPASALLEVLDPEQNNAFVDHYLDVPFDLSNVMFITTANQIDTIPHALHDRMEVISIPGYSEEEKLKIAQRHLVKKVMPENGLLSKNISFQATGLKKVVSDYTRESGVRNLERELSNICRKVAVQVAEGKRRKFVINKDTVKEYLGAQKFHAETANRMKSPGIAIGLAWTASGGDVLFIESTKMPGKGNLILTGQLGDVMKESATAALSWIRSNAEHLKIKHYEKVFAENDFHIHFPEGAIPKDGPSAGITMVVSLISLLTNKRIPAKLAMTGEMTLRGKVLPVGGIKEKMLAARRSGIKEVILPAQCKNAWEELPDKVKKDLKCNMVETRKNY